LADAVFADALSSWRQLLSDHPSDSHYMRTLGDQLNQWALVLRDRGELAKAVESTWKRQLLSSSGPWSFSRTTWRVVACSGTTTPRLKTYTGGGATTENPAFQGSLPEGGDAGRRHQQVDAPRRAEALARRFEAERQPWQKLWQEVEVLRQRAASPPKQASPARP